MLSLQSRIQLNNGVEIPALGLGVYQTRAGASTRDAVARALEVGYRHFDTAKLYGNEADVGEAIRASGVAREDVFVTTKLWNADHGYDAALEAFDRSVTRLGLDQVDLYLIHWPVPRLRSDSWRAMEQILAGGRCRSIGVSNYTVRHLKELLGECDVVPAVNQVEFSPFLYQAELLAFCREYRIQLEAYSPLTKGRMLDEPRLGAVARRYGKTPAQILIRWALQHDLVVIPKSADRRRIEENADVFDFDITDDDMSVLNALNENLHTSWDPTDEP